RVLQPLQLGAAVVRRLGRGDLRGRGVRLVDGLPGWRFRRTGRRLDDLRVLRRRGLSRYSEAACRHAVTTSDAASCQIGSPLGRSELLIAAESGGSVLTRSHSSDSGMPSASRRMTGEVVMSRPPAWSSMDVLHPCDSTEIVPHLSANRV